MAFSIIYATLNRYRITQDPDGVLVSRPEKVTDLIEWRYLFSPLRIGGITVRNRILSTAHITGFAEDHLPNDRHAAYYAERARGGIGLIVMEGVIPHPTGVALPRLVHAWRDEVIPGFRKIADAVHRHGAKGSGIPAGK